MFRLVDFLFSSILIDRIWPVHELDNSVYIYVLNTDIVPASSSELPHSHLILTILLVMQDYP